jgi:hypothetical protein
MTSTSLLVKQYMISVPNVRIDAAHLHIPRTFVISKRARDTVASSFVEVKVDHKREQCGWNCENNPKPNSTGIAHPFHLRKERHRKDGLLNVSIFFGKLAVELGTTYRIGSAGKKEHRKDRNL